MLKRMGAKRIIATKENPSSMLSHSHKPVLRSTSKVQRDVQRKSQGLNNTGAEWDKYFVRLKAFRAKTGHPHVPSRIPDLGRWVKRQRLDFTQGRLPKAHEIKLDSIGFCFDAILARDLREQKLWVCAQAAGLMSAENCLETTAKDASELRTVKQENQTLKWKDPDSVGKGASKRCYKTTCKFKATTARLRKLCTYPGQQHWKGTATGIPEKDESRSVSWSPRHKLHVQNGKQDNKHRKEALQHQAPTQNSSMADKHKEFVANGAAGHGFGQAWSSGSSLKQHLARLMERMKDAETAVEYAARLQEQHRESLRTKVKNAELIAKERQDEAFKAAEEAARLLDQARRASNAAAAAEIHEIKARQAREAQEQAPPAPGDAQHVLRERRANLTEAAETAQRATHQFVDLHYAARSAMLRAYEADASAEAARADASSAARARDSVILPVCRVLTEPVGCLR
jgi:hypothetical protein